jgi:hypothetical protein
MGVRWRDVVGRSDSGPDNANDANPAETASAPSGDPAGDIAPGGGMDQAPVVADRPS